jgi:hypothetical protein
MSASDVQAPTSAAPAVPEPAPGLTLNHLRGEIQADAQRQLAANAYVQGAAGALSTMATAPTAPMAPHDPREPLTAAALGSQLLAEGHRRAAGSEHIQAANRLVSGVLGHPATPGAHGPASTGDAPPTPNVQELQGFLGSVSGMLAGAADRGARAYARDHGAYPTTPGAPPAMPARSASYDPRPVSGLRRSTANAPGAGYDPRPMPGSRRSTANPHDPGYVDPRSSQYGSTKEDARASSVSADTVPARAALPARSGLRSLLFGGGGGGGDGERPRVPRHYPKFEVPKEKGTLGERLMPTLELAQHEEYKLRRAGACPPFCTPRAS